MNALPGSGEALLELKSGWSLLSCLSGSLGDLDRALVENKQVTAVLLVNGHVLAGGQGLQTLVAPSVGQVLHITVPVESCGNLASLFVPLSPVWACGRNRSSPVFWVLGLTVEPDSLQGRFTTLGKYRWGAFKGESPKHPKQTVL